MFRVLRFALTVLVSLSLPVVDAFAAEKIFFSSSRAGLRPDNFHIWMMNPDGTGAQQLTFGDVNDIFPELSPDGTTLVFARGVPPRLDCPSVWVLNLVTGVETPVTAAIDYPNTGYASIWATWSPDGTKLAFTHSSNCGSGRGIWVVDYLPTIENLVQLTSTGAWPSWSPDGTNILFGHGVGGLSKITLATGVVSQVIASVGYEPKYSPDGTRIVWTDPASTLRVYTASVANPTGTQTALTTTPGYVRPAWSPDGTQIAMWNHVTGGIWTIHANGTGLTRLTTGLYTNSDAYPWWGNAQLTIPVQIDIKPGSFPNSINRNNRGNVPVALLGSATFDATTVDRRTVMFADASPLNIGQRLEDINSDGWLDLVFHFNTQSLYLPDGTVEACMTGKTIEGRSFQGCDSVRLNR